MESNKKHNKHEQAALVEKHIRFFYRFAWVHASNLLFFFDSVHALFCSGTICVLLFFVDSPNIYFISEQIKLV